MDWFDLALIGLAFGVAVLSFAAIKFFGSDLAARTIWSRTVPRTKVPYPRSLRVIHIAVATSASVALLIAPFFRRR